jgi:hypothetical protein
MRNAGWLRLGAAGAAAVTATVMVATVFPATAMSDAGPRMTVPAAVAASHGPHVRPGGPRATPDGPPWGP